MNIPCFCPIVVGVTGMATYQLQALLRLPKILGNLLVLCILSRTCALRGPETLPPPMVKNLAWPI